MYCEYCGEKIEQGQKYCWKCGEYLGEDTEKENPGSAVSAGTKEEPVQKNNIPKIAIISGAIIIAVILSIMILESIDPKRKIIGRWENIGGSEATIEFLEDGTCIGYDIDNSPIGVATWSLQGDSLELLPEYSADSYTYDVQFDGDIMILGAWTDTDYERVQYIKVK